MNIFWEVFTREEHDAISKLVELGERDNIAQGVIEMTPEKEIELQKIADQMRPIPQEFESEAQKQFQQERLKEGKSPFPESPEEEKELQKKLDDEMSKFQAEHKAKSDVRLEVLEATKKKGGRPPKKVEALETKEIV